eukprot:scaffold15587_cov73-Phaeocystis_antarctica.AAC.4
MPSRELDDACTLASSAENLVAELSHSAPRHYSPLIYETNLPGGWFQDAIGTCTPPSLSGARHRLV